MNPLPNVSTKMAFGALAYGDAPVNYSGFCAFAASPTKPENR